MPDIVVLGANPLSIEDVLRVSREGFEVRIAGGARTRIADGRARLLELLERGERIYGVNTGVGGNIGISLAPEQMELMQHNLVRHLSCATGAPLPNDVVRASALLRLVTFMGGASAVRNELVDALAALLNRGVTPVVPRYGSVGASGDLMPSAYIARVLVGIGEAEIKGRRLPALEALEAAGLRPILFAPKEALALMNGTTVMTAAATLVWADARRVLRSLLAAVALAIEAMQAPDLPFHPWVHEQKGHPGQIAVAAYLREMLEGSAYTQASSGQSCYSLRCVPQGLGQVWEALEDSRAPLEREINSANDNPLIDPETGAMYKAGNFFGGHIARLLDAWKIDFAAMANW
ncbi:MAG TPA: aromatic amino acid ammonia-lyase, partial [Candidatus Sulfopaludibacter sp.]|nr:aromatic amino acid ammonia-lyase [Candidatus Sulfopaludibacter sp.]